MIKKPVWTLNSYFCCSGQEMVIGSPSLVCFISDKNKLFGLFCGSSNLQPLTTAGTSMDVPSWFTFIVVLPTVDLIADSSI